MIKDIDKDFQKAKNGTILFLGKIHSLNREEIVFFLEKFNIQYVDMLNDDVSMAVEGTLMTPLDDEISYETYKKKIPAYTSEQFEKLYANALNDDSILMSLKLSNDQKRLFRLLHNTHLDKALFVKLFSMYDWGEEGLFDTSENMEICTLFSKRFYHKERFDPATFYSPISIFEIAIMSEDADVLEALFFVPELEIKQSRNRSSQKRPRSIKEALATNHFIKRNTLERLTRLNSRDVDYFLAQNTLIDDDIAHMLLERGDSETIESLSCNASLGNEVFARLITHDALLENIVHYQKIDLTRYKMLKKFHDAIGFNENLTEEVVALLLDDGDKNTLVHLAKNSAIDKRFLNILFQLNEKEIFVALAQNPSLGAEQIKVLSEMKSEEIDLALALNESASLEVLEVLYNKDNFDINKHLALNASVPLEHLQQLQLDTRLLNYLKENSTFTEAILNKLGI